MALIKLLSNQDDDIKRENANIDANEYKDYDNELQKLTKDQLQLLLTEHVINGQNLYNQKMALLRANWQGSNQRRFRANKSWI